MNSGVLAFCHRSDFRQNFIYKDRSCAVVTTKSRITNANRKSVVAKSFKICRSAGSKALGLMFSDEAKVKRAALLFEFGRPGFQSLHMFFVFYKIDVLFLDANKQVVDVKEGFRPFTVYNSSKRSKYVIELPAGAVAGSRTKKGDRLEW